jgi:hypothetical protein
MVVLGDAKFKKNLNISCQKEQRRKGVEDPEHFVFWYKF